MGGLARITKMFGAIVINDQRFVWDYVADEAVPEKEMPFGSERHKASERRRWHTAKTERLNDDQRDVAPKAEPLR